VKLSTQSIRILEELKKESSRAVHDLEKEGYDQSMVHRSALELQENGLVDYSEEEELLRSITEEGEEVIENGSPEHSLLQRLEEGPAKLSELQDLDLDVALGIEEFEQNEFDADDHRGDPGHLLGGEADHGTDDGTRVPLERQVRRIDP